MTHKPPILSNADAWTAHRRMLLAEEKAASRDRDELAKRRREHPWLRVDEAYVFDGPSGPVSLTELFVDHEQLIVYHFMFAPDWTEMLL